MSSNLPASADGSGALAPARPSALALGEALEVVAAAEPAPAFNWRRYVAALARYKWLIVVVAVVGTAAGVVATRFMHPEYVAQATLWIERSEDPRGRGPIRTEELLEESYSWVELLKSYVVLDEVIRRLRLYLTPGSREAEAALATLRLGERIRPGGYRLVVDRSGRRYELRTAEGSLIERGVVGGPIGARLGFDWVPPPGTLKPGAELEFSVTVPRDAAQRLADELDARLAERGTFLRLTLVGAKPERLARILNAVQDRFVEVAAELKRAKLDERTKILREQLATAEKNLQDAEVALESFRVQTITLPSQPATPVAPGLQETRDPVFSRYFDMKIELEQLRRDRAEIERALADARRGELSVAALEVIPSVQKASELTKALQELATRRADLRALRNQYTDEHLAVRRLAAQIDSMEELTVPRLARALLAELAVRDAELSRYVASASSELQQIPPRAIEEARLQRRVVIAENLYRMLRENYEETRLAAESSIPDVRVLDRAVPPQKPAHDERPRIVLLAFMGSLGLALAGAILLDRMDPRLRYPEQITQDLGVPILGAVPRVRSRQGPMGLENAAEVIEAFRGIRLNLQHAYGNGGPLVVPVTSPGPGDGKSFVSSNLALAFAEQGHRTLLIDGDIRRGGLHRLFQGVRKPGLTDYLAGRAGREEIVQATAYPGLHLIGCGTRMQSGPELLASERMAALLEELRALYTVILVDTPPLGAGVDPFVFGTATGNLLLVLRTGLTDRELAGAKLSVLGRLPVRVLGAVLNDVSPHGLYGYYRHYSYLPGYEAAEEEGGAPAQLTGA